jgi:hypothetical protein
MDRELMRALFDEIDGRHPGALVNRAAFRTRANRVPQGAAVTAHGGLTMRRLVSALALLLLLPGMALAGPQVISWSDVSGATSYGVEASADLGTSWTAVTPTVGPACTSGTCSATVNAPATGYWLVRIVARNAVGSTVRYTAGPWVCESCAPPAAAQNLGVR